MSHASPRETHDSRERSPRSAERIGDRDAWRLRVTYPDGFVNESFVDKASWRLIARRFTAPVHAFGASVTSQAIIGDYRPVNGVLFPFSLREVDLATGAQQDAFTWQTVEANAPLDYAVFLPPPRAATPVSRLVNGIFTSRHVPADALGWYHDFQRDPATASVDIEAAIESVGYECLKNGAIATGTALLEENLRSHPTSARAHFGVGRAYRAAGRETDAMEQFREAQRRDRGLDAAKQAMASRVLQY
ncbi:MAG: tetratricopeptide repeat protein [Gemmatimonadaceae bacterium]